MIHRGYKRAPSEKKKRLPFLKLPHGSPCSRGRRRRPLPVRGSLNPKLKGFSNGNPKQIEPQEYSRNMGSTDPVGIFLIYSYYILGVPVWVPSEVHKHY